MPERLWSEEASSYSYACSTNQESILERCVAGFDQIIAWKNLKQGYLFSEQI